ncbi:MAG: glycoside hydrolase family protein [Brevundimonas sp.]|nr:glycoside hydrolase family protein [Brevundimonas sp.]
MSAATTPRLKVSREGIVLIKSFEGFRPRAVRGEDGRWVIGYGHTASAREGLTVGEPDAELLLQYDLLPVVRALNERAPADLNQHQFDALASFAISVGVERFLASDVLQRLNEGLAGEAADALIGWPEAIAPDDRLRRRAAERALFVADPAASVTLAELLAAPLPPPPIESPVEPTAETSADARAAAVAALLGEAPAIPVLPEPSWAPEEPAFSPPAFKPVDAVTTVNLNRYSPYAAAIIGPLPGFEATAPEAPAPQAVAEPDPEPETNPTPVPDEPSAPVVPLTSASPADSPFPPMDQALVLTPATEADFVEAARPAWTSDQREATPPAEETVLFEDEPTLSVLRHEVEPTRPRRFDWSETGAFLIMGGVGLAACTASAAAFRLSVEQPSPMGETTVIAWALAVIGVICVGVSSWNLYVRWGRPS